MQLESEDYLELNDENKNSNDTLFKKKCTSIKYSYLNNKKIIVNNYFV